jgi:hypothetical protein
MTAGQGRLRDPIPIPMSPGSGNASSINGTGCVLQGLHASSREAGNQRGQRDVVEGTSLHTSIIRSLRLKRQGASALSSALPTRQLGGHQAEHVHPYLAEHLNEYADSRWYAAARWNWMARYSVCR